MHQVIKSRIDIFVLTNGELYKLLCAICDTRDSCVRICSDDLSNEPQFIHIVGNFVCVWTL